MKKKKLFSPKFKKLFNIGKKIVCAYAVLQVGILGMSQMTHQVYKNKEWVKVYETEPVFAYAVYDATSHTIKIPDTSRHGVFAHELKHAHNHSQIGYIPTYADELAANIADKLKEYNKEAENKVIFLLNKYMPSAKVDSIQSLYTNFSSVDKLIDIESNIICELTSSWWRHEDSDGKKLYKNYKEFEKKVLRPEFPEWFAQQDELVKRWDEFTSTNTDTVTSQKTVFYANIMPTNNMAGLTQDDFDIILESGCKQWQYMLEENFYYKFKIAANTGLDLFTYMNDDKIGTMLTFNDEQGNPVNIFKNASERVKSMVRDAANRTSLRHNLTKNTRE